MTKFIALGSLCLAVVVACIFCLHPAGLARVAQHLAAFEALASSDSGLVAFGDSITCGGLTSDYPKQGKGFASLLAKDIGGPYENWGYSGGQSPDITRMWIYPKSNPHSGANPLFTVMMGVNDAVIYGADRDRQQIFQSNLMAALTWLALPREAKLFAQDSQVRKTGSWIADDDVRTGLGMRSPTPGSKLDFMITTTGAPVYLAYRMKDCSPAAASVSVDGQWVATLHACEPNGAKILTGQRNIEGIGLLRYPVAAGKHNVLLTVLAGAEPANGGFSVLWAGTPTPQVAPVQPGVLVGGVIRQQGDQKKELTAFYDSLVHKTVETLAGDGLPVRFVPVRKFVNADSDMADTYHPGDIGHQHLRQAFESVLRSSKPPQ
jgi:hypothetical protein